MQSAAVEAQMAALFNNLNNKINLNQLDEAAEVIKTMRSFLNTPAFQGLRSIQERKELYTQAINSFETMLDDARKNQAALAGVIVPTDDTNEKLLADLQEQKERLEKEIADKDKALASLNSGSGDTARRLSELERSVTEKDRQIQSLESRNTTLTQTNTSRENTIASQQTTINTIRDLVQGANIRTMQVGELERSLEMIKETLGGE
jgi:chromosome segregation ATPase